MIHFNLVFNLLFVENYLAIRLSFKIKLVATLSPIKFS